MRICEQINFPVAEEKTEGPTVCITFLGMLLNGQRLTLMIPDDKKHRTINILQRAAEKKKLMIREIQELTGILNFLNKAICSGKGLYQENVYRTDRQAHQQTRCTSQTTPPCTDKQRIQK